MRATRILFLSLGISIVTACSGPESTGIPNAGGRRSYGGGGSAGDFAGTVDPTGTGGDFATGGAGGIDMSDAQPGELPDAADDGAVADSSDDGFSPDATPAPADARNLDAASDAPVDVNARDVVTTADCMATPWQDSQCSSGRPPHRYVCPLSIGTPTGCQRVGTSSTTAAYCCP